MNAIKNFESLTEHLRGCTSPRARIAVVCASDQNTEEAVDRALNEGFADVVMVGPGDIVDRFPRLRQWGEDRVRIVDVPDRDEAARRAVRLVRDGEADIVMKGLINTDNLLHAVLDKENGLLPKGHVLTHIAVMEVPGLDRLLFFSDAAVIPFPTLPQRAAMVQYMAQTCRNFGLERPRIALVHCSEKISAKFPITMDYVELVEQGRNGAFGEVIIDGPMDFKTACEAHSGAIKGIVSPIEGHADGLIFPDIEAANAVYKVFTLFVGATPAGMLMGTTSPVVLPSRSDSAESKFYSMAMACLQVMHE